MQEIDKSDKELPFLLSKILSKETSSFEDIEGIKKSIVLEFKASPENNLQKLKEIYLFLEESEKKPSEVSDPLRVKWIQG